MKHREQPWDKDFQFLLVLTVGFNIIPHFEDVPNWTLAIATLFLVWKSLYLFRGIPYPPRSLLWTVSAAGVAGIFLEHNTIIGPEPASAILVFLTAAKLLETNHYRDATFVICSSYFLLMTHLLNSQTLVTTVFMCVDILLLTVLMYFMHSQDRRRGLSSFRPVFKIVGAAVPVWIFLFFAFPRFSTGLMNFNRNSKAQTGLSDSLRPGSISQVVQSEDVAFRVEFPHDGKMSLDSMYWRATYLESGDGLNWNIESRMHYPQPATWDKKLSRLPYEIWLEPTGAKHLIALEYSEELQSAGRSLNDNLIMTTGGSTFETIAPITSRIHYSSDAALAPPTQQLSHQSELRYLTIPQHLDPRILALAHELTRDRSEPRATRYSDAILQWFHQNHFTYTLQPGELHGANGAEQMAEFLFKTRTGFCEHYAASFATLMRVMGIPTRVVIGYQGGKINALGHYVVVRSLEAHAWTEIWQRDQNSQTGHWLRVDPTAEIAPLRLQLGGDFNRLDHNLIQTGVSVDELREHLNGSYSFFNRASYAWDVVQMRWNSFLISYDLDFQQAVLSRLGVKKFSILILTTVVALGLAAMLSVLAWFLRRRERPSDRLLAAWHAFVRKLETPELKKRPEEGALTFAKRAQKNWPTRADEIAQIAQQFIELRYGTKTPQELQREEREFSQSTRRFSIDDNSA